LLLAGWLRPQTVAEDFLVSTEHPRLFLGARRLRLLKRENERQSLRWRQFQALMTGQPLLPEPGFALALYSQVTGDEAYCRQAVDWALGPGSDLRQLALVFDWCQPALTEEKSRQLAVKIERGISAASDQPGTSAVRDRVLAAVALGDQAPAASAPQLRRAIESWWRGEIVPGINHGRDVLPRGDLLAVAEILHAVRDNLGIDLRDPIQEFFRQLPLNLMLGYYPGPFPTPEGEYHIPAVAGGAQPDPRRATLSRASELSLVAYDSNTQENQFLQGWLTRDPFLLRSPLGAPYELLWANPYLPGLSYYHAPLVSHDRIMGTLFVRSSWDEDATWLGYFGGELQVFTKEGLTIVKQQPASGPILLGDTAVVVATGVSTLHLQEADLKHVFLLGLRPGVDYEVRVGDEVASQQTADPGGILAISPEPNQELRICLRERTRPPK